MNTTVASGPEASSGRPAAGQRTRYLIWRQQHGCGDWIKTAHVVSAISDADAQARMRRLFANAGLHSMALIAVAEGLTPNANPASK